MLDKPKGLTMAEIQELVQKGADAFDKAETKARSIKASFRSLRKVFEGLRDLSAIGSLESQALAGECDALATRFEADVWALHAKLTARAKELGIDLPAPRSGGGGR